jgi:hypothetical protein
MPSKGITCVTCGKVMKDEAEWNKHVHAVAAQPLVAATEGQRDMLEQECRDWLMNPTPPVARNAIDLLPSLVEFIRTREDQLNQQITRITSERNEEFKLLRAALAESEKQLEHWKQQVAFQKANAADARAEALEEAARLLDSRTNRSGRGGIGEILANTQNEEARQCAEVVRAVAAREDKP